MSYHFHRGKFRSQFRLNFREYTVSSYCSNFRYPVARYRDNVYAKSSAYNYAPLISLNLVLNEINHENESDPIGLLTLL